MVSVLFFWVFFYGLLYSLAEAATPLAGNSPWLTPLVMLGYILILLFRHVRAKQLKSIGLSMLQLQTRTDIVYLIPLLFLPLLNLSGSTTQNPPHYILLMFSVCFAEELLFRGYLLSFLVYRLGKWGILCTALAFSLLHSANLFSGASVSYVMMQILLAFFAGFYYSLIRIYFKSLYPCIIAHFLTNITASGGNAIAEHYPILIALLGCFGLALYFKISFELEDPS